MSDPLEIGNFLLMFYGFSFLVFAAVRFRVLSRPLLSLVIPLMLFSLIHGIYHVVKFLDFEELPAFVELTSTVVIIVMAVQLMKERL